MPYVSFGNLIASQFAFSAWSAVNRSQNVSVEFSTRILQVYSSCLHSKIKWLPNQKRKAITSVKILYDKMSNFATPKGKVNHQWTAIKSHKSLIFLYFFSSEQKRRLKAEEKAKEKAKKAENAPPQEEGTKKKGAVKEEEISPNEYFKLRSLAVQQLKTTSCPPYPHKFHVDTSLQDFIEKFTYLVKEQSLQDQTLSVAGLLLLLHTQTLLF